MLFSLVYFLVGRVLGTGRRSREGRDIELLVLRHQVRVLQRQVKRPRLRRLDRLLLAAASKAMPKGPVVFVRRQARDPAPLAPGARQEEVDIQEERAPRSATDVKCECPLPDREEELAPGLPGGGSRSTVLQR